MMVRQIISKAGGTRAWTKLKNDIVAQQPMCWLRFPRCTIRSQTADHYHTVKARPDLANVPSNLRGACLYCNRARRDTPPHLIPKLRAELEAKARTSKPKRAKALGFFS